MIGAIIGDIIGSRFEFNNSNSKYFELFTPKSSYTDDTICTIAIADAINTGVDYKTKLLEWCRKYPNPMGGYGAGFAAWVRSKNPKPYNSFGNGAAMRVAPVAYAWDDITEVLREAERTALVTHNHPEGVKGARAVAHSIFHLRITKKFEDLEYVMDNYYPSFMDKEYTPFHFDETCQGTVPLCAKIVLESKSFEDAIRNAIAFGGDSDTIGAIVGALAEPIWGVSATLFDKAINYLPTEMVDVIRDYFCKLNIDN